MRSVLILIVLLFGALPAASLAQADIPFPRPRPADRMPAPDRDATPDGSAAATAIDAAVPRDAAKAALAKALGGMPHPVTLSAKISDDGPLIPSGLTWRIYSIDPQQPGQLGLVARSTDAAAVFSLTPGEYQAHVAYGNAQMSDTVLVGDKPTAKTLILDSGALRLNAQVTGDIPIAPADLRFDIFPTDAEEDPTRAIATDVAPNQAIELNAGIYHVVSHYGKINAVVKSDLRVDPGQLTEATLFHDAAPVNFRLVSEVGGEAIADVEWSVRDADGKTVFTDLGAFPHTILAKGDYTVVAELGNNVYNRDFQVTPGNTEDIEVLTTIYAKK